jgi:hypothetical protein
MLLLGMWMISRLSESVVGARGIGGDRQWSRVSVEAFWAVEGWRHTGPEGIVKLLQLAFNGTNKRRQLLSGRSTASNSALTCESLAYFIRVCRGVLASPDKHCPTRIFLEAGQKLNGRYPS